MHLTIKINKGWPVPAARPTPETPSSFFFNEDLVDISCEVLQCRFQESEVTLNAQLDYQNSQQH